MPSWLATFIGVLTGITGVAAFAASRIDARRRQREAKRSDDDRAYSQWREDAKSWRDDYKAIRERLVAAETHVREVEAACKRDIAARDERIGNLERQVATMAMELSALRPGGRP